MSGNPLVESRIRDIRSAAADRAAKREEAAAKRAEQETRATLSPNDVIAAEKAKANWKYWCDIDDARVAREYHEKRNAAIAEMSRLKNEWDAIDTTPARRRQIVRAYGLLYRTWQEKPGQTSDEALLAAWEKGRRDAYLARVYNSGAR